MFRLSMFAAVLLLIAVWNSDVGAEKVATATKAATAASAAGEGQVQAKQKMQEGMANMKKYGTPGEQHRALRPFVGRWKYTARFWMMPGGEAMETKGRAQNSWELGRRFVKHVAHGRWAGQKFTGIGYTGYDKVRGEYISTWMDNMSTGIMLTSGSRDEGTDTITQAGHFSCPMTGEKKRWTRTELKVIDKNHHAYIAYAKTPDGKEFKSMEITYTRVR